VELSNNIKAAENKYELVPNKFERQGEMIVLEIDMRIKRKRRGAEG
jgi:hypothetical protein